MSVFVHVNATPSAIACCAQYVAIMAIGVLIPGTRTSALEPVVRYVTTTGAISDEPTNHSMPPDSQPLLYPAQLMTPLSSIDLGNGHDQDEPPDYAVTSFQVTENAESMTRYWETTQFSWAASALWHRPLYFEDVNLERHGLSFGIAQPAASGAHFFGSLLALPYHAINQHPHECVFNLGQCRPGNCVPYHRHCRPIGLRGGVGEAATIVGLILLIP